MSEIGNRRLRALVPGLVLAGLVPGLIVAGSLLIREAGARSIRLEAGRRLGESLRAAAEVARSEIRGVVRNLALWGLQSPVMDRILDGDPDGEIQAFVEGITSRYPSIRTLAVVDPAGRRIASSPPAPAGGTLDPVDPGRRERFRRGDLRAVLAADGPTIRLEAPILRQFDRIELLGVLRLELDPASLVADEHAWWCGLAAPDGSLLAQRGTLEKKAIEAAAGMQEEPGIGSLCRAAQPLGLPPGVEGPAWSMVLLEPAGDILAQERVLDRIVLWMTLGTSLLTFLLIAGFTLRQTVLQRRIEQESRRARAASRAKSVFLASMSHEIRTPLNGILGMSDLLMETDLDADQRDQLHTIQVSAEALLNIINDILDFSKIEAGKLELEAREFDLHETVENAVQLMASAAAGKRLELSCHVHPGCPRFVRGDSTRLRQVLVNLLGNAVKFTHEGEVALTVASEEGGRVRFEVRDTGIGIPKGARERIFEAFTQADSSTTRRYGGTGLGLAISLRLVALMGGWIECDSKPGRGSTFRFAVPFEPAAEPSPSPSDPAPPGSLNGMRVLAVDDNPTNREILPSYIASWGMDCDVAEGPRKALRVLEEVAAGKRRPYDLAILDMQMADMDGLQLARAIHESPAGGSLALVMLTSIDQRPPAAELEGAGIRTWLTKPVRQSQLFDALQGALAERKGRCREEAARGKAPETFEARVLVAEDNRVNQIVARRMMERCGCMVEIVSNGREAVEAHAREPYDIIFMDCLMPEMDGYQAAGEIRKREAAWGAGAGTGTAASPAPAPTPTPTPTPIIAMTANAMQGDRETCLAAGMSDYLSKPFRADELVDKLRRWIGSGRGG